MGSFPRRQPLRQGRQLLASLTVVGETSPSSALALDRFAVAGESSLSADFPLEGTIPVLCGGIPN
ncbi:MAG: hypothetical protein H0U62_05420 [Actinobacteria bacterium]|nr:hypothetical protein [Actinomycetota bacterium]